MKQSNHFALKNRFVPAVQEGSLEKNGYWFIFSGDQLLVESTPSMPILHSPFAPGTNTITPDFSLLFGYYDSVPCFLAEIEPDQSMPSMTPMNLRALFSLVDEDYFSLAGRAMQILHHTREHRFCSRCATPMKNRTGELARFCPACDFISFPRVSPAVIMSVVADEHILLGRGPHFTKDMYSTLAGFVEAGETLEEAVCREVFEETGIVADQVRYVASQPWPFPHSVMIGFTARYRSGEIKIDTTELEDAAWFHYKELPKLPSQITIARLLIENFIDSVKKIIMDNNKLYPKALSAPAGQNTLITQDLIKQCVISSQQSPRGRIILPLHKTHGANLHRMLNAIQPGSYIQPHRHLHPPKAESIIVLQGAIFVFIFTGDGSIEEVHTIQPGSVNIGIDSEPGVYHTFVATQKDTVIFEVKPGPYNQADDKDFAPWAPTEVEPEVKNYMTYLYEAGNTWLRRH